MGFWARVRGRGSGHPSFDDELTIAVEAVADPAHRPILLAAMEFAREAGACDRSDFEPLIEEFIDQLLEASWEGLRTSVRNDAAAAAAIDARAPIDAAALREVAQGLLAAAAAADRDAHDADVDVTVTGAARDVRSEEYGALPLVVRVPSRVAWVAAPATAAGLGVLVHLALGAIDDSWSAALLIGAAIAGALAAEILLGLLGAELYDRLPPARRPRAVLLTLILILLIALTTEGFAVFARQAGVNSTNAGPQVDPNTGALISNGPTTPTLLWTGPLSILLTIAGAGSVGVRGLREGAKPYRDRLRAAEAELADARKRKVDAAERCARLHREAADATRRASSLAANAAAQTHRVPILLEALEAERARHDSIAQAFKARVLGHHRIVQERPRPVRRPPVVSRRRVVSLAFVVASLSLATLVAGAGAIAGVSPAVSVILGSATVLIMIVAARAAARLQLRRTLEPEGLL
ncbi:MAG: hypothetical protein V7607_4169 [Solirubrobacteraceae bacterium]